MDEKVKCEVCGKEFEAITPFHLKTHNLTMEEYRRMFPDTPIFSEKTKEKMSEIQKNNYTTGKRKAQNKGLTRKDNKGIHEGWSKGLTREDDERIHEGVWKRKTKDNDERLKKISDDFKERCVNGEMKGFHEGLTDEQIKAKSEKAGKTLKERYDNGEIEAWNKGKTKDTDSSVKKISDTQKENWQDPKHARRIVKSWHIKPNNFEKAVDNILQHILPNQYNVNVFGEFVIAGKIPDFINVNGEKKIIECYGDYWHTEEESIERIKLFKKYGFETLIIWEREMENIGDVINKILAFHNLSSLTATIQTKID